MEVVDLAAAGSAAEGMGVVWTLAGEAELNVNLVHLDAGQEIGEHTNTAVDVVFVGVDGAPTVTVDGESSTLSPHVLVWAPRGTARGVRAGAAPALYLSLHRRRPGPAIGPRRTAPA